MKKLFKITIVALFAVIMVSCGGASEDNFVGKWTPDFTSVEFHLHDDLVESMGDEINEKEIKASLKEAQPMASMINIEFKEDGVLTVGAMGENQDLNWSVEGSDLVLSGTVPEGEFKGKEVKLAFEILDSNADEFTIKISAQSIKEQLNEQYKSEMDKAISEAGDMKNLLDEKVLSDTWASITFKKKES
ncbi:MAG: hypothetical protein H6599_08490 [Flavobacteriales bacterium]|nr:hypothetical protein [Flavobacteriales bacterium]